MRKIKLSRREAHALIDNADYPAVSQHRWYLTVTGYAETFRRSAGVTRSRTTLHRFILGAVPGTVVDHVNGDKLDCRRSNLRLCTEVFSMELRGRALLGGR